MDATLILLSGGKSSRMGRNKALLSVDGKANIKRMLERLQTDFQETILVTNQPQEYHELDGSVTMVKDIYPGLGPLSGIHAGLHASTHDINLVVACDMPFVSPSLATYFIQHNDGYDAVIPKVEGRNQPLFAVYKKSCLSILEECLQENMLRVNSFLSKVHVRYLEETNFPPNIDVERVFYNMNQPEEYDQVQQWVAKEKEQ